jgi:hypothetical protein
MANAAAVPPVHIQGPAIILSGGGEASLAAFSRRLIPFMPPKLQQQVATDPSLMSSFVGLDSNRAPSTSNTMSITIGEASYPLAELGSHDSLKAALNLVSASTLWGAAATGGGDSGESHSVLSAGVGGAAALLSSRQPPVAVHVVYVGTETIREAETTVCVLPTLTGLQMKSAVLAGLGLSGGFQDYFLRCDGDAFGSRMAISSHPGFGEGCTLQVEDVAGRPKAVGHT